MQALVSKGLAHARADYVEIRAERRTTTQIAYVGEELEEISQFTALGASVRALVKGGWGFASFNDLDRLPHYVRLACQQAATVGRAVSRLAPVEPATDTVACRPALDPRHVPLADKEELCRRYNERIRGHRGIQTSVVRYRDSAVWTTFVSTDGAAVEEETVFCGIDLGAFARDGMNVQQGRKSAGGLRGYDTVRGLDADCETIVARALALLAAEPVQGGRYSVVADPVLAGVFAHEAFGHLSEADVVYENPQLRQIMRLGRRFAPDHLCIVDDPTLDGLAGSYHYDAEGTPARRTELIRDGILASRLHSRETAARMDEKPTGNARAITHDYQPIVRMSNTYIEPRAWAFADLIADTGEGLYARGALGGETQIEMFTFSAEEAFLIRDGAIAGRVRDVVLSGNVFETLGNIDAVGNDLAFLGGLGGCGKAGQGPLRVATGAPHIRIRNCLVGGR